MLAKAASSSGTSQDASLGAKRCRKRRARAGEGGSRERAKVPRRQPPPVVRAAARPEPDEDSGLGFDEAAAAGSEPPPEQLFHASNVRVSLSGEDASDGFVPTPTPSAASSSDPTQTTSLAARPTTFVKGIHPTSRCGRYRLELVREPESRHRARYQTEGSRGAVKDSTGKSSPQVVLRGCREPCQLQMYVGSDSDGCSPHLFYQACRVTGKTASSSRELTLDGTVLIETPMTLESSEDAVTARCDCLGILKQRNVDIETRVAAASAAGGAGSPPRRPSQLRKGARTTTCRLVFRVSIVNGFGERETLQVSSRSVLCTQPQGVPEVTKLSLREAPCTGGAELIILGKNFVKDSRVVFSETEKGEMVWSETVCPQKEHLQAVHLVCTVPAYWDAATATTRGVQLAVRSGDKESDAVPFAYLPVASAEAASSAETGIGAERRAPPSTAVTAAGPSKLIHGVSQAAIAINRRYAETGQIRLEARRVRQARPPVRGTLRGTKVPMRKEQVPRRAGDTVYLVACPVMQSSTAKPNTSLKLLSSQPSRGQRLAIRRPRHQRPPMAAVQHVQHLNASNSPAVQSAVNDTQVQQQMQAHVQHVSVTPIQNLQSVHVVTEKDTSSQLAIVRNGQESAEQTQRLLVDIQQGTSPEAQNMSQMHCLVTQDSQSSDVRSQNSPIGHSVDAANSLQLQSVTEAPQTVCQVMGELDMRPNIACNQHHEVKEIQQTSPVNVERIYQAQTDNTDKASVGFTDMSQTVQLVQQVSAENQEVHLISVAKTDAVQTMEIAKVEQLQQVATTSTNQAEDSHFQPRGVASDEASLTPASLLSAECTQPVLKVEQDVMKQQPQDIFEQSSYPEAQQGQTACGISLREANLLGNQPWSETKIPVDTKMSWSLTEQAPTMPIREDWSPAITVDSQTQNWSEKMAPEPVNSAVTEAKIAVSEPQWPQEEGAEEQHWSPKPHSQTSSNISAWASEEVRSSPVQDTTVEQPLLVSSSGETWTPQETWSASATTHATPNTKEMRHHSWATSTACNVGSSTSWCDAAPVATTTESAVAIQNWSTGANENIVLARENNWTANQIGISPPSETTPISISTSTPVSKWSQVPNIQAVTATSSSVTTDQWTTPVKPVQADSWAGDHVRSWSPEQIANVLGDPIPGTQQPTVVNGQPQVDLANWPTVSSASFSHPQQTAHGHQLPPSIEQQTPVVDTHLEQQILKNQSTLESQYVQIEEQKTVAENYQPVLEVHLQASADQKELVLDKPANDAEMSGQQQPVDWTAITNQETQNREVGPPGWEVAGRHVQPTDTSSGRKQHERVNEGDWSLLAPSTAHEDTQDREHRQPTTESSWMLSTGSAAAAASQAFTNTEHISAPAVTVSEWTSTEPTGATQPGQSFSDPMWSEGATFRAQTPVAEDPLADMPQGMGLIEYINGDHE